MGFRVTPLLKLVSTSVNQPAFGSWVTAGLGLLAPSDVPIVLTLGTAAVAGNDADQMFIAGEEAWLVDPNGTHGEAVKIRSVLNNTVTLGPQTNVTPGGRSNPVTLNAHPVGAVGTGAYLIPKQMSNNILVWYEDGGAGPWLYVGKTPNFTANVNRIFKLAFTTTGVPPAFWNAGMFSPGNPIDLSELFVRGTANDQYITSIGID